MSVRALILMSEKLGDGGWVVGGGWVGGWFLLRLRIGWSQSIKTPKTLSP